MDRGWRRLIGERGAFRRAGGFPIPAYSEFMPPPRIAIKPSGALEYESPFPEDDPFGWRITAGEQEHQIAPGLPLIGRQIVETMISLATGRRPNRLGHYHLEENPYWPAMLHVDSGSTTCSSNTNERRGGEEHRLSLPELGTKRVCPSCAARFYDLQKRPIECPKCSFAFEPELLLKQRRTRLPEEAKPAPPVPVEDEEESESADEEAAEETADEELEEEETVPEADEPLVEADVDADEDEVEPAAADEAVQPEEFEEELDSEEEEDDELLEEVEEDEDDVSGIIDTDIEKDEP